VIGNPITVTTAPGRSPRTQLAAILLASIAVKIFFIWYLGDRLYFDNVKAVNFGFLVHRGDFSIHEHFVNSKTFVGPLLWFQVYDWFGVPGLKVVNVIAFLGLFVIVHRLGVRRSSQPAVVLGLFLFAFYAGTNRNIVAGEPDDNVAALCFGLGVLAYLNGRSRLLAGALMGVGFLFKFWIAVFCLAFGVFLVWKRRWRDAVLVTTAAAVPFAVVNVIDGFTSMRSLLVSERIQHQLSSWPDVGSRAVSTGMLVIVAASAWSCCGRTERPRARCVARWSAHSLPGSGRSVGTGRWQGRADRTIARLAKGTVARSFGGPRTARFSPDGRWVAFVSGLSSQSDVYVQEFPAGARHQVSTAGGTNPRWRRDGKELFYVGLDGKLMTVATKLGSGFEYESAKPLFDTLLLGQNPPGGYASAANGQRFLMQIPDRSAGAVPFTVITNWLSAAKP
jgi:WD40-like Beta Propeller Repeat